MRKPLVLALGASLPLRNASAHSFGQIYNLPVPLWMYTWGAVAALVASFVVVGWFVSAQGADAGFRVRSFGGRVVALLTGDAALGVARVLGVGSLLLTCVAGFVGISNPYANISMTLFWIVFVLGLAYVSALVGNVYAALNPWRALVEWSERLAPGLFRGRVTLPPKLGVYPALVFYAAFICIELFGHTLPFSLAVVLVIYSACNFIGAWLLGKDAWFSRCEFFGVFFGLLACMALVAGVERNVGEPPRLLVQQPFAGLLRARAPDFSTLLFVLFMLSSTAYDGVRDTVAGTAVFWKGIAPLLTPWVGSDIVQSFPLLRTIYHGFQYATLLLSPLLYLGVYLLFIDAARRLTRTALSTRELALDFAYTLLPIVLVYNLAHYFTLLVTQGPQLVHLLSDPFGRGWNVLGTSSWLRMPYIPDAGVVWHVQVWLILSGHIVSVYLAHVQALRVFSNRRLALLSQLPMLLLMVLFTTAGLWILAQPIQTGQVVVPVPVQR